MTNKKTTETEKRYIARLLAGNVISLSRGMPLNEEQTLELCHLLKELINYGGGIVNVE